MKKRYVVLGIVWMIFALIFSINNLTTVKLKYFVYQNIIKEYNWGQIDIRLDGNWREENANLSIAENPYTLIFVVDKNSSDNCTAKLNYLSLKKNNSDNVFSVSERIDVFEDSFTIDDTSANSKFAIFFLENIFLEVYSDHTVSFGVDIVCNGKVTNSIEEKNLIFYINYYEENLSWFEQIILSV